MEFESARVERLSREGNSIARLKKMHDYWSAFLKIDNNCGRHYCLPNDQSFCAHSTSKLPITNLVLVTS